MTEIRRIIELLSKILFENGFSEIKADVFRKAKFNKPEAIIPMWKLLFETICFCNCRFIDESIKNLAITIDADIIEFVKQGLINLGYVSPHLNNLPNDATHGSRELLLAFGWLFCRKKIMNQMIKSNNLSLHQFEEFYKEKLIKDNVTDNETFYTAVNVDESLDKFLTLNNNLRLNLNDFFSLELENAVTNHKIMEKSKDIFGEKNLSGFDIYLLHNPDLLKKYMDLIENDNCKLEHFLDWKEKEATFWQWMESVLEAKVDNEDLSKSENGEKNTKNENLKSCDWTKEVQPLDDALVDECRNNLFLLINRYSDIISFVENSLKDNDLNVSTRDLDYLLESLDTDICNQTMAFKNLKLEKRNLHFNTPQKFILVNEPKSFDQFVNLGSTKNSCETDINFEINKLKEMIGKKKKVPTATLR